MVLSHKYRSIVDRVSYNTTSNYLLNLTGPCRDITGKLDKQEEQSYKSRQLKGNMKVEVCM